MESNKEYKELCLEKKQLLKDPVNKVLIYWIKLRELVIEGWKGNVGTLKGLPFRNKVFGCSPYMDVFPPTQHSFPFLPCPSQV